MTVVFVPIIAATAPPPPPTIPPTSFQRPYCELADKALSPFLNLIPQPCISTLVLITPIGKGIHPFRRCIQAGGVYEQFASVLEKTFPAPYIDLLQGF